MTYNKCMKKIILSILILLILTSCSLLNQEKRAYYTSIEELNGKNIGILKESMFDEVTKSLFDDSTTFTYYSTFNELMSSLRINEIQGFVTDRLQVVVATNDYDFVSYIDDPIANYDYGFMFSSGALNLRNEFNEFLSKCKEDGYLDYLKYKWMSPNCKDKVLDKYEDIEVVKGKIKVCSNPETMPFSFMQNAVNSGYELDLLNKFAHDYSYIIDLHQVSFKELFRNMETSSYDIALGAVSITDERAKTYNFSDPIYTDYSIMCVAKEVKEKKSEFDNYFDLNGHNIGALNDSAFISSIKRELPNSNIKYYPTRTSIIEALRSKEIDGYVVEEAFAVQIDQLYDDITYISTPIEFISTCYIFSNDSLKIKDEFNKFILKCRNNDYLSYLQDKWIFANSYYFKDDDIELTGENGTLKVITSPDSEPFSFYKDGSYNGYEVELLNSFCKEYGYDYNITSSTFDESLKEVKLGKYDLAFNCIILNEERSNTYNTSDPIFNTNGVLVVRCSDVSN